MARGGARPGAGRKPGAGGRPGPGKPPKRQVYATPVREAERRIRDRLPELVDMALELALKDRDPKMVVYCIDRILGKPTQPVDVLDATRRLAEERGLDPDKVVSIFDGLKKKRTG